MWYRYAASYVTSISKTVNTQASYVVDSIFDNIFVLLLPPPPCSKQAESGRGKPCSLAYWLVDLVFTP